MTKQESDKSATEQIPTQETQPSTFSSPLQLLLITAFAVFAGEVMVMFVLSLIPPLPTVTGAILDGFMITVLATPFLYMFLFRPMVLHIAERHAAEVALLMLIKKMRVAVIVLPGEATLEDWLTITRKNSLPSFK